MKKSTVLLVAVLVTVSATVVFASGTVWSEVIDNVAYVHHDDAWWNCCPDTFFEIKPHHDTTNIIDIYEWDRGTHPCDCMCYFDFCHTLEGLEPGTYLARVWECYGETNEYNTLAGTTMFTILDQVGTVTTATAMSECHDAVGIVESIGGGVEVESLSPVTSTADVQFTLSYPAEVHVEIYNVFGSLIRTIDAGNLESGDHTLTWDTHDDNGLQVSRGTYFIRLEAGDQVSSLPLIVLK